jgi:VWFA-related protein
VDVTVTDRKGQPVTDLKADDFEVLQNGRPQRITNFSYASAQPAAATLTAAASARAPAKGQPAEPPAPPPRLKPEQVRRALALVVDDLTLSFESTASVRDALKKFVDNQMQPGDLVAIIRTGAGMGALQQFTNDKRQLYAAIERVRWKPGYAAINTFAPVSTNPAPSMGTERDTVRTIFDPAGSVTSGSLEPRDLSGSSGRISRDADQVDSFRREVFAVGTLGALSFLVKGLKELPGRKSVILFSDALRIYNREESVTRVKPALDNLTDLANRAAVSFYTIDARGLQVLGMTAADDLSGDLDAPIFNPATVTTDNSRFLAKTITGMTDRQREFFESQEGLEYLANRTGGIFTRNTNDLNRGVSRALRDQEGYYLIGFVPDEGTFKTKNGGRQVQNLAVKVKRAGLSVRTRTGFYGAIDEEPARPRLSQAKELLAALASPFGARDIHVRMTSQFWQDPKGGAFVNALLHIDAADLTFEETVNGWRKTSFEIAAFTFGDNGQVIDHSDRLYSVSMSDKDYRRTLQTGIFYRINLPIKKPGAYQLRAAVRDQQSKKLGSANQFIEIPDLKKGRLALSGLIVRASSSESPSPSAEQLAGNQEGKLTESDPQAGPAVRRFGRGQVLEYGFVIYGAKPDKSTSRPDLATRLRLYRDGQLVYDGNLRPFDPRTQTDPRQLIAGGSLRLGNELTPGEYALQVIVVDKLAKEKDRLTTGWIDFEIVR